MRIDRNALFALALVLATPWSAWGQPLVAGTEFQVNVHTTGTQEIPSVAALADGGFVLVWSSEPQDGSGTGVFARRYDAAGAPMGGELAVNTYTLSDQTRPAVAAAAGGGFLVVWHGAPEGIRARAYDAAGLPIEDEFQVNSYTPSSQLYPAAAAIGDDFVVVWESFGQLGPGSIETDLFGQRLAAGGTAIGTEFLVNSYTTYTQFSARVAGSADGSFVVVWASYGDGGFFGGDLDVRGQRFDAAGQPAGTEFVVNTYTTDKQSYPAIARSDDGGFLVVWNDESGLDGDGRGTFGRLFDGQGDAVTGEFQVNTYTTGSQDGPVAAFLSDGSFAVAWTSRQLGVPAQDGDDAAVVARRFDALGTALGSELAVNAYTTGSQERPTIAPSGTGGFVVAWQSGNSAGVGEDGDGTGVFGRRFDSESTGPRPCGDPIDAIVAAGVAARVITAVDALAVLRTVVGLASCELCVCDVDGSGMVLATDALIVLRRSVGLPVTLACPPCP